MVARVGVVYDPRFLEHDQPSHPENAERLKAIVQELEHTGLIAKLVPIPATPVAEDLLLRIHEPHYLDYLAAVAQMGGRMLDPDTYMNSHSYEVALLAAGGTVNAVETVLRGEVKSAFALVRPPGHHALSDRAMGFCLLNNIALAAQHAISNHKISRVLIVDFDVHHGNGTQDIFYERSDVLYFSAHQYPYYPGTGHWKERGQGPGEGYTVNVPLPAGVGDEGYERVFAEILEPLASKYQPELILVSAGYDGHWRDPIAGIRLSTGGYAQLVGELLSLAEEHCSGRIAFVLEGGYDLKALAASVAATLAALLGEEPRDPLGKAAEEPIPLDDLLRTIKEAHGLL